MSTWTKTERAEPGARRILVGDIGATRSRLAIYGFRPEGARMLRRQTYASSEHGCLTEVLARFLRDEREIVSAVCLGVPGPVRDGEAVTLTNLPWFVDREQVHRTVGTDRVALINDVQASAAGLPELSADDVVRIQDGDPDPTGNRVVVSFGTGLGVSVLTPNGHAFATEGGHTGFAPRNEFDFELQRRMRNGSDPVSWERMVSGPALTRIHAALAPDGAPEREPAEIVRRAPTDAFCREAVETLRRYMGSVAGDLALTLMATGGVYLTGGVATPLLGREDNGPFVDAFRDHGAMRSLLERVPVYLVDERDLALQGAARTAMAMFEPNGDHG